MGCRSVVAVDGAVPLADSAKVEFRWKWETTEAGRALGLSGQVERGVAYVAGTGANVSVKNLYLKGEE
jgi:hypothetical protein